MTDLRKVVTSQKNNLSGINRFSVPETDKYVCYNTLGTISTTLPQVMSAVYKYGPSTVGDLKQTSYNQIMGGGTYGEGDIDVDVSAIDPRRYLWYAPSTFPSAGAITYTLPSAGDLVDHLKSLYGPENVTNGLLWKLYFLNPNTDHGIHIVPSTGWETHGFNQSSTDHFIQPAQSVIMFFLLRNVVPGSELASIFMFGDAVV